MAGWVLCQKPSSCPVCLAGPTAWLAVSARNATDPESFASSQFMTVTAEVISLWTVMAESNPQAFISVFGGHQAELGASGSKQTSSRLLQTLLVSDLVS